MRSADRFLVTGAGGFVGARLCHTLAGRGFETHALLSPGGNAWRLEGESRLVRHAVDLRDSQAVHRVVLAVRPTIIYHLASHGAYPHQSDAVRIMETNVLGLTTLMMACEAIDYRLFVHAGSSSEYGRKSAPMQEADELVPESVYGVSKAAQSLLCRQWARQHARPIVVFRLFSVYGPLEEPTRLIPRLVTAQLDDVPIALVSPRTSRDFIYVDDVVEVLLKVERLTGLGGAMLNLGTGVQTTLHELVQTLESIAGKPTEARWSTMSPRAWDTETWVADPTKLREALEWSPSVSVREGLERSLEWFRSNRRYYPADLPRQ